MSCLLCLASIKRWAIWEGYSGVPLVFSKLQQCDRVLCTTTRKSKTGSLSASHVGRESILQSGSRFASGPQQAALPLLEHWNSYFWASGLVFHIATSLYATIFHCSTREGAVIFAAQQHCTILLTMLPASFGDCTMVHSRLEGALITPQCGMLMPSHTSKIGSVSEGQRKLKTFLLTQLLHET